MNIEKFVKLKTGKEIPLKRFHPWVFSGAIQQQSKDLQDGDWVEVKDHSNNFLGIGHFHKGSIAVKVIQFKKIDSFEALWIEKIEQAKILRESIPLDETNAYRLVHGEGDNCPGLIIDYYNQVFIIQAHSIGIHKNISFIKEAILKVYGKKNVKAIYDKSKETLPQEYAQQMENQMIFQDATVPMPIKENGIQFAINWVTGQKTGFFLDQRDNRELLAKFAKGKDILNTFCYSGGFSLYGLKAGAKSVISLDASAKAIDLVNQNIELNGFQHMNHEAIVGETLPFLRGNDKLFDIIILDPPAFAKSLNHKHKALQGYQRINELAMQQIRPNGLLFTFSCSQVITRDLFYNMLVASAINCGREIQVIHQMNQGADHPVNIFHPESHYLKGFVLRIK
jgi:23S rRNA (cytosine1962-C5)-methyltransferase